MTTTLVSGSLARALAEVFASGGADAIAAAWDARRPVAFPASPKAAGVIGMAELEEWLDYSLLRHPYFSATVEGDPVELARVASDRMVDGEALGGFINGAKARRFLGERGTLIFGNLQDWNRPAALLCDELAQLIQGKVGAMIFWSGPGAVGLRPHRDGAHVFVIQVSGSKRFFVYDAPGESDAWKPGYTDVHGTPAEFQLTEGNVLYIPCGAPHRAETSDGPSVHLSFVLRPPSMKELLSIVFRSCLDAVDDQTFLPADPAVRTAAVAGVLARALATFEDVDPERLVQTLNARAIRATR